MVDEGAVIGDDVGEGALEQIVLVEVDRPHLGDDAVVPLVGPPGSVTSSTIGTVVSHGSCCVRTHSMSDDTDRWAVRPPTNRLHLRRILDLRRSRMSARSGARPVPPATIHHGGAVLVDAEIAARRGDLPPIAGPSVLDDAAAHPTPGTVRT